MMKALGEPVQTNRSRENWGFLYGFLGMMGFSLTLPATRAAVADLDPIFVGLGRALVAGVLVLATIILKLSNQKRPTKAQWKSLRIIAVGIVLGFPLLSTWAM
jgi:drug/metabolite transporter (DMT)-like permease